MPPAPIPENHKNPYNVKAIEELQKQIASGKKPPSGEEGHKFQPSICRKSLQIVSESKKKEEYICGYQRLYKQAVDKQARQEEQEAAQLRQRGTRPATAGPAHRRDRSQQQTSRTDNVTSPKATSTAVDAQFAQFWDRQQHYLQRKNENIAQIGMV